MARPLTGANPEQRRGEPGSAVLGEVLSVEGWKESDNADIIHLFKDCAFILEMIFT